MTGGYMGLDPVRRRAAGVATLVAIPAALLAGLGLLWAFGAFARAATDPVAMPQRPLPSSAATVCRTIIADLPDEVTGLARRPVTAGTEQNAAYGDPPLTVACGTAAPSVEPTALVYNLSGICWLATTAGERSEWTTVDRQVPVTVTVPSSGDGPAQAVIAFSAAIRGADPARPDIPSGCT